MQKYKKVIKSNKFEISAPTWNEVFELPDGSYTVSDIQDYFEFITKKHETFTNSPPLRIYVNKIENKITFKIKTRYYLNLLTLETTKLLESAKRKITQDEIVKMCVI